MATVSVDFDGVIHENKKNLDPEYFAEAIPGAFLALAQLQKRYAVIIQTYRKPGRVLEWMRPQTPLIFATGGYQVTQWEDRSRILITNQVLPVFAHIEREVVPFHHWAQALVDLEMDLGRRH